MNKIHRPQECINANCVNMCSIAQYEGFKHWFGNNPEKCPLYKKGGPINVIDELEKIKAEIDLIKDSKSLIDDFNSGCERIEDLIDNHIAELKGSD